MMSLDITQHAMKRMKQRGFHSGDIEYVMEYGTPTSRGYMLSNQDANEIVFQAKSMIEMAHRLKGTLVASDGRVVKTIFKASRHQQSRIL